MTDPTRTQGRPSTSQLGLNKQFWTQSTSNPKHKRKYEQENNKTENETGELRGMEEMTPGRNTERRRAQGLHTTYYMSRITKSHGRLRPRVLYGPAR